jgi:hypothetical protein
VKISQFAVALGPAEDRHPTGIVRAEGREAREHASVVRSIRRRRYENNSLRTKTALQLTIVISGGIWRIEPCTRRAGEARLVDVNVAVA